FALRAEQHSSWHVLFPEGHWLSDDVRLDSRGLEMSCTAQPIGSCADDHNFLRLNAIADSCTRNRCNIRIRQVSLQGYEYTYPADTWGRAPGTQALVKGSEPTTGGRMRLSPDEAGMSRRERSHSIQITTYLECDRYNQVEMRTAGVVQTC